MPVTLSCPSCNTAFTLPATPPDRRAECPRCHDVFPIRGQESGDGGQETGSPSAASPAPFQAPTSHTRPPGRRRLAAVAGVVAVVAVAAVVLTRGGKEPKLDPGPQ